MITKCLTIFLISGFVAVAADKKIDTSKLPPASDKKGVTYDKDIKPIFEKSCFKCHGPEKQKAKLRLDSLLWLPYLVVCKYRLRCNLLETWTR